MLRCAPLRPRLVNTKLPMAKNRHSSIATEALQESVLIEFGPKPDQFMP